MFDRGVGIELLFAIKKDRASSFSEYAKDLGFRAIWSAIDLANFVSSAEEKYADVEVMSKPFLTIFELEKLKSLISLASMDSFISKENLNKIRFGYFNELYMHITLDANDFSKKDYENLLLFFMFFDDYIDSLVPADRRKSMFCRSIKFSDLEYFKKNNELENRYYKVRPARVKSIKAVEFRFFGNTYNFEDCVSNIIFCLKVLDLIKNNMFINIFDTKNFEDFIKKYLNINEKIFNIDIAENLINRYNFYRKEKKIKTLNYEKRLELINNILNKLGTNLIKLGFPFNRRNRGFKKII